MNAQGGKCKSRAREDGRTDFFLRAPLLPTLQYESILQSYICHACEVKKCQNEISNKIYHIFEIGTYVQV